VSIQIYESLVQGSEEWFAQRCGLLTASEMKLIITPGKLQAASNEKSRGHLDELLAQRITGHVEPSFVGDDMLRGKADEQEALEIYNENYAPVQTVGFITNDKWGFKLGYSPDGLVGTDGAIEVKGRRQKFQVRTILDDAMPDDFLIQVQTGLLVSERKWCDFITFCGGLPMFTKRIAADPEIQEAIIAAATVFEANMKEALAKYQELTSSETMRLIPTERRVEQEIFV
jgi:hypothetical protein